MFCWDVSDHKIIFVSDLHMYIKQNKQKEKTLLCISVTSIPLHSDKVFFLCWELAHSAPLKQVAGVWYSLVFAPAEGQMASIFGHYLCSVQNQPQAMCTTKGCGCVEIKFYLYTQAGGPPGLPASHLRPCGVFTKSPLELVPSVASSLSSQKYFKISFSSLAHIAWLDSRLSKSPLQFG